MILVSKDPEKGIALETNSNVAFADIICVLPNSNPLSLLSHLKFYSRSSIKRSKCAYRNAYRCAPSKDYKLNFHSVSDRGVSRFLLF